MTPAPACAGNPWPFDTLIDHAAGLTYRAALREARTICGGCPLRATCLPENVAAGEHWAAAVLAHRAPTQARDICGTSAGANAHYKRREAACEPCKLAARLKKRNKAVAECGTDSGYHRHKRVTKTEPCGPCRTAHAELERRRAERKKAAVA